MLIKKENSLYRVRGRKLQGVYLALDTAFAGNRDVCSAPTEMVRWVVGSCSSSASLSPPSPPSCTAPASCFERKLGRRSRELSLDNALGLRCVGRRGLVLAGSSGESSSPDCPQLPAELRFSLSSSSMRPLRSSSSGSSFLLVPRSLPTRRFLSGILAPSSWYALRCSFDWRRGGDIDERGRPASGSSSSRSSSRSESSSGAFGWWYSCGADIAHGVV